MGLGLGWISSVAGFTTAQYQETPRFKPCVTRRKVERSELFEKGLDLMSVWGHHFPLKNKINITMSVYWTINRDRFRDHLVVFST